MVLVIAIDIRKSLYLQGFTAHGLLGRGQKSNKRYPFHMGRVIICVTKKGGLNSRLPIKKFSPSTTKGTGIL
nr:MAG TPA: hypothetical protein [Caudoviricetes sp.]